MKKACVFFLILSIIFTVFNNELSATAKSKEKMRLAILDLQAKGVSKVIGIAVSDLIRSDMVDTGRFVVVERAQMDAILKEHELQQTGCTDSSCAVQVGKILSANKVLIGEINKLGSDYIITARVVDVEKGVAEFSTSEKAVDINEIDKTVRKLVDKLTLRITGKRSLAGETGAADFYLRGIVPGWGQMYAGKTLKGGLYMGGFAAAGCAFAYTFFDYKDKKKAYDDVSPKASKSTFDTKYDEYNQSYNVMLYAAGIWGLIYIANWVDMLFITDSPGVMVSGIPCENGYIAFDVFSGQRRLTAYSPEEMCLNMSYKIKF